jgi:hypothetical protein
MIALASTTIVVITRRIQEGNRIDVEIRQVRISTLLKPRMHAQSVEFALKHPGDKFTERNPLVASASTQRVMHLAREVLDLKVRHSMILAC